MSDEIQDVNGPEARRLVAEFLGQHMGAFREIDSRMVSQATSLRPATPNIQDVLNSVPVERPVPPIHQVVAPVPPALPPGGLQTEVRISGPANPQPAVKQDTNQLELNFTPDVVRDITDRLVRIEGMLKTLTAQAPASKQFPLKKT